MGLKFCRHCGELLAPDAKEGGGNIATIRQKKENETEAEKREFSAKGMSPEKFRHEVEKRVGHKLGGVSLAPVLLATSLAVVLILGGAFVYSRSKNASSYTTQVNDVWQDLITQADKLNTRSKKLVNADDLPAYENDLGPIGREIKNLNFALGDISEDTIPDEHEILHERLVAFGNEFDGYLERIKFLIRSLDQIEKEEELGVFDNKGSDLEQSYDDLILANRTVLKKSFPRETFRITDNLKIIAAKYLETKLADEAEKESGGDAVDRIMAQQSVEGFMDAYLLSDENKMKEFMTIEAVNEFSYDYWFAGDFKILSYRILSTNYMDAGHFEVVSREQDETLDGYKYTVDRLFKVSQVDDEWRIDVVSYSYG